MSCSLKFCSEHSGRGSGMNGHVMARWKGALVGGKGAGGVKQVRAQPFLQLLHNTLFVAIIRVCA